MRTFTAFLALAITFTATAFAQQKGTFKDTRDGKTYKTVKIGGQTWMAENLSYRGTAPDTIGVCYDNKAANCTKYGRLYDNETAKKACPAGWHLPINLEWRAIMYALDESIGKGHHTLSGIQEKFRSKSGWNTSTVLQNGRVLNIKCNGTDNFGFSILPGGFRDDKGNFQQAGDVANIFGLECISCTGNCNGSTHVSIRCVQGSELTEDEIKAEVKRQEMEDMRLNVKWREGLVKGEKEYLTKFKCGTNKEDKSMCEQLSKSVEVKIAELHSAKIEFYAAEEKATGQINKDYIPTLLENIKIRENRAKEEESESNQYKCRTNEADVNKCFSVLWRWSGVLGGIDALKQEVYRLKGSGEKVSNDGHISLLADYVKLPEKQAKLYESESSKYKCLTDNMDVNKCEDILRSWGGNLATINNIKNQIYALKGSKEKANTDAYFPVILAHSKIEEKKYLKQYEEQKCRATAEGGKGGHPSDCWGYSSVASRLKGIYNERQKIYKEKGSNEQVNIDPYIAMRIDPIKYYEREYERTKNENDKKSASNIREELLKEYPNHPLVKKLQEAKK